MRTAASIPQVPGDYSRVAGIYLEILGWFLLLSLNLAGIALIFAGQQVREHNRNWWWVAVLLCGLQSAVALVAAAWMALGHHGNVLLYWHRVGEFESWLSVTILGVGALIFGLPLCWLLSPATRRTMRNRRARLCMSCGYDLRASNDKCPECGYPIPFDQSQLYAELLNKVEP